MERTQEQEPPVEPNTFWLYQERVRAPWRLLSFFVAFVFAAIVSGILSSFAPDFLEPEVVYTLFSLIAVLAATVFCLYVFESSSLSWVGLGLNEWSWKQLLAGIVIAAAMMGLIALMLAPFGWLEIRAAAVDAEHALRLTGQGLFLFVLVALNEEILMRGYPFQVLIEGAGKTAALIITSVLFSALHFANPNMDALPVVNLFLAGIWLGAAYLATKSLWLPIGLHFGWNFMQGTVLGFPVSGMGNRSLLLSIERGEDWVTGGAFGPEGGVVCSIVLIAGALLVRAPFFLRLILPAPKAEEPASITEASVENGMSDARTPEEEKPA